MTALGLSSAGTLLAACGQDDETGTPQTGSGATPPAEDAPFALARKDNPVTLPLHDDVPAVASGLEPEAGPLKIYN
ncbi:MAG: hypothetical protein ACRDOP_15410, partial [Gaiellaceae bacterium]